MIQLRCSQVLLCAIALCACDRQVDREYQGESLLRITGNVVIPLGLEGTDLVPAIAFNASSAQARRECSPPRSDQLRYVEVAVSGDFPSSFQLDLFDPPPAAALQPFEPGGPRYATGSITALTPDHPDAVLFRANSQETYEDWPAWSTPCEGEDASVPIGPNATTCMVQHACRLDGSECLKQTLECHPAGTILTFSECELKQSEGDESLLAAGYSVNYRVVYFADAVEAGSVTAQIFTNGDGAAAGYHLYRIKRIPNPGQETQTCLTAATFAAVARYNTEHGTEYEPFILSMIGSSEVSYELAEGLRCEISREIDERGCLRATASLERVASGEVISIELGAVGP
ncbi:MAG TPA: hypothetical protein VK509_20580 [Polyangiales bacterium]|nr:hypothetical protein [Polyangiales bacterium]